MSDLREHFATAGSPRNTWTEGRGDEAAVLGALGMADELGAALWRLKWKGDPRVARRCVTLMASRLGASGRFQRRGVDRRPGQSHGASKPAPAAQLERLAFRVIFEWVNDRCTVCHGRGTVGQIGHVRPCGHCRGSCREPVDSVARARDLGVSLELYRKTWEWRMGRLLAELEALDEAVRSTVRGELQVFADCTLSGQREIDTLASNDGQTQSAA